VAKEKSPFTLNALVGLVSASLAVLSAKLILLQTALPFAMVTVVEAAIRTLSPAAGTLPPTQLLGEDQSMFPEVEVMVLCAPTDPVMNK
jgi:hypothetical protein